jgi:flagellar protein FlbD
MIRVHRLNGAELSLNAELIELVEAIPDTAITLATGNRLVVRESVDEVLERVVEYRRQVYASGKVPNPIEGFVRK